MFHFLNCMVLAFAPHVICYKATKLSDTQPRNAEENGLRACFFAALGYAATQIIKIFVMATILPSSGDDAQVGGLPVAPREFHLFEELAKCAISLIEIVGVQQTLQLTPNLAKFSSGTRILAIGLGMAFAESALKCLIPIVMGARGAEFSWTYLELALTSNVALLLHLAFVSFVWLRMRTDVNKATLPIIWAALAAFCAMPTIDSYLTLSLKVDSWTLLAFHGVASVVACLLAKLLLRAYNAQRAAGAQPGQKKGQ